MNHHHNYFDENDMMDIKTFHHAQHSSIIMRTKTAYSGCKNVELIKSNSIALPVHSKRFQNRIEDPIRNFRSIKEDYVNKKLKVISRLASLYRLKKISNENNISRREIKDYITLKYIEPTPYVDFSEGYCYYPHHGTLKKVEMEKGNFLAHTMDCDTIRFDKISSKMPFKQVEGSYDGNVHPTELILNENSDYAALRGRNFVNIAKLEDLDSIKDGQVIKTFHKFQHKNDIFASSLNFSNLLTVDSKYVLRKFNLNHQYEVFSRKITDYYIDDRLHPISLCGIENDKMKDTCASITTKKSFGIIDFRNKAKISLENHFSSNNLAFNCEKIFNHTNSCLNNNLVYIASSHLLYAYDYRKLKESVVQWTHQLYNPPMILSTARYRGNEIICASSHMVGDLKIFNNDEKSVNFYPFKPENIRNTYNRLQEQGLFLLSDHVKERINGSITGVCLQTDTIQSSIKLFTQNYFGDIFETDLNCLDIKHDGDGELLKAIEKFQLWENFLDVPLNPNKELTAKERIKNGDLIVDDIVRFTNLPKYLNDQKTNEIIDIDGIEAEDFVDKRSAWKVNIEDAKQCNDLLAKEIMYLWEDVDDSLVDEAEEQEDRRNNKVSMWLNKQQEPNAQIFETENLNFEPEISSTQMTPSNTKESRRKSRLAGF